MEPEDSYNIPYNISEFNVSNFIEFAIVYL